MPSRIPAPNRRTFLAASAAALTAAATLKAHDEYAADAAPVR